MGKELKQRNQAIIVGASIAGLCTAAALAPFFKKVIIFDRDASLIDRKSTPHRDHPHSLLSSGINAIEELLPGFKDALVSENAIVANVQNDYKLSYCNCWMKRHLTADRVYLQHRRLLEKTIHFMLERTFANIEIKWGVNVTDMTSGSVSVGEEIIYADFIVDAAGRFSKFADPYTIKTIETNIDLMYSTMEFENVQGPYSGLIISPTTKYLTGMVALKNEDRTFITAVFGYHEGKPGVLNTVDEWLEFVSKLPTTEGTNFLKGAKPLFDKPKTFVYKSMKRKIYKNLPFIVIGDADSALDPVFAQGMSKAALQAKSIKKAFTKKGFATQKDIEKIPRFPHLLCALDVSRYAQVDGYVLKFAKYILPVLDHITRIGSVDNKVYDTMFRISNLEYSPLSIFTILHLVIWHSIFTKLPQGMDGEQR